MRCRLLLGTNLHEEFLQVLPQKFSLKMAAIKFAKILENFQLDSALFRKLKLRSSTLSLQSNSQVQNYAFTVRQLCLFFFGTMYFIVRRCQ
jgi:hypothetical protein